LKWGEEEEPIAAKGEMPSEVEDWEEVADEVGRKVKLEFSKVL
jgi:hypothetical protein